MHDDPCNTAQQLDPPMVPAAADGSSALQQADKQLPHAPPADTDVHQLQDQCMTFHPVHGHHLDSAKPDWSQKQYVLPAGGPDMDAVPNRSSRLDQQLHFPCAEAAEDASASHSTHLAVTIKPEPASQEDCNVQQLQRCATNLSSASQQGIQECRICLAADNQEDLVQPCNCTGSVQYAHMECLKSWVQERCNLQCELCGKQYKDEVAQRLLPLLEGRRPRRSRSRTIRVVNANGETVLAVEAAEDEEEQPRPRISWTRFWIHLGILVMLLVAVLYLALFVNVGASDNFWLMFLWRAITVILPLFLIIRCVAALYAWRQQYVASRLRGGA
jgi:hypothetical protein